MKLRQSFADFIFATNTGGSGKASSYIRALDMLDSIIKKLCPKALVYRSKWRILFCICLMLSAIDFGIISTTPVGVRGHALSSNGHIGGNGQNQNGEVRLSVCDENW